MDNRISLVANLKDCISTRNSIILPVTATNVEESPSQQDVQYSLIRKQVRESHFFACSNRHIKIRLQKWLQYLDRIKNNKMWIKSRNKYIKLLNLMCYCECLLEPFISMPPEGELPTLRKHEVNTIIDQVQRQIKSSAYGSRRMSQNNETVKQAMQNQMQNIFANFTQQQRRFQTYSSNSCFEDDSAFHGRQLHNNDQKRFDTEGDEKTIPMRRISLEPQTMKMIVSLSDERSDIGQLMSIPEEFNNMKPKTKIHGKNKQKFDSNNFQTRCSGRSSSKEKKEDVFQKQVTVLREISLKDFNRQPICPSKYNYNPVYMQEGICKQDTVQKEYWEENSEQSPDHSEVVTPRYLNNLSSQQGEIQECVEIVSFREREGDNCDCTSQILGQGWISSLLKKIAF